MVKLCAHCQPPNLGETFRGLDTKQLAKCCSNQRSFFCEQGRPQGRRHRVRPEAPHRGRGHRGEGHPGAAQDLHQPQEQHAVLPLAKVRQDEVNLNITAML